METAISAFSKDEVMKSLSDYLMKNPTIVVVMFFVGILSGIFTLILGAKDIYKDYLSKSLSVPAWLVILTVIVFYIAWVVYGSRTKLRQTRPNELVADAKFGVESVATGGRRFVACTFDGTELVIDGKPFDFEGCTFSGQRFVFDGPAAQTIAILSAMYQDPPFQPLVDQIFTKIKQGDIPVSND